jgi:hypothetical protein
LHPSTEEPVKALPADTAAPAAISEEELDADEAEFKKLRCDLPGVKGASAVGIVTISVNKLPAAKNEFFRTHPEFGPEMKLVVNEEGMDKHYYAVSPEMENPLVTIGISYAKHKLYLCVSPKGAIRIVPINSESDNEYNRTKEIGLLEAREGWFRVYTDRENSCYRVYPADAGRFADPTWPDLKPAKIIRLAFRDKGRLIDTPEHPLFKKWMSRDR